MIRKALVNTIRARRANSKIANGMPKKNRRAKPLLFN
jgi:hypothetical protein